MKIKTTTQIKDELIRDKLYVNKKWVAVDDIFEWVNECPEDLVEDLLMKLDFKKFKKEYIGR